MSRRLSRPLGELDQAVGRIATGDLDHRISLDTGDEIGSLAGSVNQMAADLKDYTEKFARQRSQSREAMIFAMAKLAESKDDDTGKHLERICIYTELLAAELSKTHDDIDDNWVHAIAVTAALHDIGKVGIPDAILKKPGKLTDDEYTVMRTHAEIGGDTLLAVRDQWTEDAFLATAADIAMDHHERWDGRGYPRGVSGEEIAFAARIVAVADVYDALTSKRCYKEAMPHDKAKAIIEEGGGEHFDPVVVEAFLTIEEDFHRTAEEHAEQT
jgi:putative two-component system response regulator